MKKGCLSKRIKLLKLIVLVIFPLLFTSFTPKAQASFLNPECWFRDCVGENAGKEAARDIRAAIDKVTDDGIPIEFGVDVQNIDTILKKTEGLVALTRLQTEALINSASNEYKDSLKETMKELTNYTKALDEVAKARINQLDKSAEDRIRQTLEGIQKETLLISSEMTRLIRVTDEAVKSSSSHISDEVQEATKTASDELARLLKITRAEVDELLGASEKRLLNILSVVGDDVAELLKLAGEESRKTIRVASEEFQVILDEVDGISRVLIANSAGHTIDITDNLSDETQEVIEVGTNNLKELASHTAEEALRIIDATKEAHLQVFEGGIILVNRTADLILAVGSTGTGILFLFISSYGFTKAFLQWGLPTRYTEKVVVFSFLGLTFIASFTPFVFSISSVRAYVLRPMGQTGTLGEIIPRNTLDEPKIQECYVFATANVRSKRSTNGSLIVDKGSKQSPIKLTVTGKKTPGGWIEVLTSEGRKAWVYKTVVSNYDLMKRCLSRNDIEVITVPDLSPPKPLSPKTGSPSKLYKKDTPMKRTRRKRTPRENYPTRKIELSREKAYYLIMDWLKSKKKIFAPPYNRQLGAKLTTGNAYQEKLIKPLDWLENNNAYYTYSEQEIEPVKSFLIKGEKAIIEVIVSEKRTLCKNGKPSNYKNTVFDKNKVRYELEFKDGRWKIADFSVKNIFKIDNPNKSCFL